jgi:6-phosphogluconolactonase
MAEEIARSWYEQAQLAAVNRRVFSVVVSGGSTDPVLYGKMAAPEWRDRIPWEWVHIFWADERCVPLGHKESNYRIISDFLLDHIPIPKKNVHRIRGEEDPAEESTRYAKEIQDHQVLRGGDANMFDWVFLGVGPDGHTASLFPRQETLLNTPNLCGVARHPKTDQMRITLTPAAINRSLRITYHVIGRGKAKIVSELLPEPSAKSYYPTVHIKGEWYLDLEAASSLNLELDGS